MKFAVLSFLTCSNLCSFGTYYPIENEESDFLSVWIFYSIFVYPFIDDLND